SRRAARTLRTPRGRALRCRRVSGSPCAMFLYTAKSPAGPDPAGETTSVSLELLQAENMLRRLEHIADLRADIRRRLEHVNQGVELVRRELSAAGPGDDGVVGRSGDGRERGAVHLEGEV